MAYSETLKAGTDEGVTNVDDTRKNGTDGDNTNEDATDFTASASDEDSETKNTALATNQIVTSLTFAFTLVLFFFNA